LRITFRTIVLLVISPLWDEGTGYLAATHENEWYEQGSFHPSERVELKITNATGIEIENCPVVISRSDFPVQDVHELWITVVDPALPPDQEPSKELLARQGTHQSRAEKNGHYIFHQLDDLDKDGIWDELFFMTDLKASEIRSLFIYLGYNSKGWNPHATHAGIGSYMRHLVPFWESENVGWKLWYPTDCDIYGKRTSQLMAKELYTRNLDGYGVPYDMGSDIMSVSTSFGGGGICLFEHLEHPDSISRPRFTPRKVEADRPDPFNVGQISDTRYAFDVIVNGPLRSMVRIKTMNWNTGNGSYELEQVYTAYAHHSFSTCKVQYLQYQPSKVSTIPGVGMKRNPNQELFYEKGGVVISAGPEEIRNPDEIEGRQHLTVDYVGTALAVKPDYNPQHHYIIGWKGNHIYQVDFSEDMKYEYLIAAGWSEGSVLKTQEEFKEYVLSISEVYFCPPHIEIGTVESK
jgi:hypothetical protein